MKHRWSDTIIGKTQLLLMYLFTVGAVIYFIIVGWWILYPYKILTIDHPIKILSSEVKAGEMLWYQISYVKHKEMEGILTRKLLNDYVVELRSAVVNQRPGKDNPIVGVMTPIHAQPGRYTLSWSVTYKVNPIRSITVSAESEPFIIKN
jgi:hypothetical protein